MEMRVHANACIDVLQLLKEYEKNNNIEESFVKDISMRLRQYLS